MAEHDRVKLGRSASWVSREVVYRSPLGFEIEASEHYEITRRRVYYEDIQLVTLHREWGVLYLVLTGVFGLAFIALVAFILSLSKDAWPAAIMMGIFGLPFVLAFLTRAIFGVDVITIFGRRSKARLRYLFFKSQAREMYDHICDTVRFEHARIAEKIAESQPPPRIERTTEEAPPAPPS